MKSNHLPQEIILDILLSLPPKSLLRFRCVSKSCNSIITNSNFITKHLLHQPNKNALYLVRYYSPPKPQYYLHFDNQTLDSYLELILPLQRDANEYEFIGCCNGLVCLVVNKICYAYDYTQFYIWNPSIRIFVTLPAPPPLVCPPNVVAIGFGFDSRTNDYKVVRIINLSIYENKDDESYKVPIKVQLYSLARKSWKYVTAVFPCCETFHTGDFLNENFHWLAYYVSTYDHGSHYAFDDRVRQIFILSFDMRDEVIREIMIPESVSFNTRQRSFRLASLELSLSTLGNSLCLVQSKGEGGSAYTGCHVWVMTEYGVAESWIKQFSIDIDNKISRELCFRNNGDSLHYHRCTGELVLQTFESKEIKYLGTHMVSFLKPFSESLVLIDQENEDDSGKVVQKTRNSRLSKMLGFKRWSEELNSF